MVFPSSGQSVFAGKMLAYNATIVRRSKRLPPAPGIGLWTKPSRGSISDFGFDHPSWDRAVMDQRHHWSDQPEIALKTCFWCETQYYSEMCQKKNILYALKISQTKCFVPQNLLWLWWICNQLLFFNVFQWSVMTNVTAMSLRWICLHFVKEGTTFFWRALKKAAFLPLSVIKTS